MIWKPKWHSRIKAYIRIAKCKARRKQREWRYNDTLKKEIHWTDRNRERKHTRGEESATNETEWNRNSRMLCNKEDDIPNWHDLKWHLKSMLIFLKRKEKQTWKGGIFVNGQLHVSSANKFNYSHRTQKHSEFQCISQKVSSVIGLNTVKNKRVDNPFSMHPVALKTHLHSNYFQGK